MLFGFEEQTAPLNDIELNAANIIADCLSRHHVGRGNAVTGAHIGNSLAQYAVEFRDQKGRAYLTGPRIRKIINYIRSNGMCPRLIASSNGYYVSNDRDEIDAYITSLRERASAITAIANKLENERKEAA